jgi:antitoxin VapB
MAKTAKLFMNGRSQAVRLPAEFRFSGDEVNIRRDETTGEIVLWQKPATWRELFARMDAIGKAPTDYMDDVERPPDQDRDPFA